APALPPPAPAPQEGTDALQAPLKKPHRTPLPHGARPTATPDPPPLWLLYSLQKERAFRLFRFPSSGTERW
ncbi:hypothetical protein, partial [Hymenobacter defluvii]